MTFKAKLFKKKASLKQSSLETYFRNIKRLRKVNHDLPVPENQHKWVLEKKLLDWYDKQPLKVQRHMAVAANVTLGVFGEESKAWKKRQRESMEQFDEQRRKRELTPAQKEKIPAKGFDSLKKVVTQMKRELSHVLPNIKTLSDLLRVQNLVILSMYFELPLRLDFATLLLGFSKTQNCIYKNKKKPRGWTVLLTEFKTAKSLGNKSFRFRTANARLLNKFVPAVQKLTTHGYLLTNRKGLKMSKQVLSKTLMRLTKKRIGKRFSTQFLRILYALKNLDVIETAAEVSDKLLHSQKQSLLYAKKN